MTKQILLMTRPRAASECFVEKLSQDALRGVDVIYAPLIEIVETGTFVDVSGYDGVIFTSANGVAFAPQAEGGDAYCVGVSTAAKARDAGWNVIAVEQDADALVLHLTTSPPSGPLLHLAGRHRHGDIDSRLAEVGLQVDVHVLYDQSLRPLSDTAHRALSGDMPVILPLFSARTAMHCASQIQSAPNVTAVVLSDAIAGAVKDVQLSEVIKTAAPTGEEMVRSVDLRLQSNRFLEGGVLDR